MRWYDPIERRWHDPQPAPPREYTLDEQITNDLNRVMDQIRRRQADAIWRAVVSTANGTTAKPSEPPTATTKRPWFKKKPDL